MSEIKHISGAAGGYLVGNSHKNGGIQAINKAVGKPLEMEGGEVVITKPAVDDDELREFEGEMLTNRQILSRINESGGGVSFAEKGAELPTEMYFAGNMYNFGGETISDHEIAHKISKCGCSHEKETFADGGEVDYWLKKQKDFKDQTPAFETIEKLILNELENRGLKSEYTITSKSQTEYGQSWYMKFENELEIRISDHSLQSMFRIMDAKYVDLINVYAVYEPEMAIHTIDRYEEKSNLIKATKNRRDEAFNELERRREYISEKAQDFLDKLESENKGIFFHGFTRISPDNFNTKYPNSELFLPIEQPKGGYEYYYIGNNNSYSLKSIPAIYFNHLIDLGEIEAEKVEEVIKYNDGGTIFTPAKVTTGVNGQDEFWRVTAPGIDEIGIYPKKSYDEKTAKELFSHKHNLYLHKKAEINPKLKSDAAFLVGLQDAKQNNKPSGGWDINLFKSSFFNKVKKLSPTEATLVLDYLTELENSKELKPVFSKNHKIWENYQPIKETPEKPISEVRKNELYELSRKINISELEYRLIEKIISVFPEIEIDEIIKLSDKIATFDNRQRGSESTGEALQYLTQDFSNIDTTNYAPDVIKRLEDLEIINSKRQPKYNLDDYVYYKTGDLDIERWTGKIVEVKDYGNEYKYRVDAYSKDFTSPAFESHKTNEIFESSLKPSTKLAFDNLKEDYERRIAKKNNNVIELTISPENNLSKQLLEHTGDQWNSIDFENIDGNPNDLSSARPFIHKKTGKKFIVVSNFPNDKDRIREAAVSTKLSDYANPYEVNRAIEKLLDSQDNDEMFTAAEKEFISTYSGYGGLEKFGNFSDNELKGLLYEYFTPDAIVKKMWALAYKYGFGMTLNPQILEPSVGTGNFFKYAPSDASLFANEINRYSKRICEILYPLAQVSLQPFEKNFIERNLSVRGKINNLPKYDLVIGNPPYGQANSKYISMGEGDYTKARNFTEYFITRGLDLCKSGGLLIFIVGAEQYNGGTLFLDGGISEVKKNIAEKAQLVDAYRLPTKIFERTGVASEILVFKKN